MSDGQIGIDRGFVHAEIQRERGPIFVPEHPPVMGPGNVHDPAAARLERDRQRRAGVAQSELELVADAEVERAAKTVVGNFRECKSAPIGILGEFPATPETTPNGAV
jgi:hypothetical protein